jgi:hypothetical protein
MAEKAPEQQSRTASESPLERGVPDLYANVVLSNVTPWDFNLIFARASVPLESRPDERVNLQKNLNYVARVALPLQVLPLLIRLLAGQLEAARREGLLEMAVEPPPAEEKEG